MFSSWPTNKAERHDQKNSTLSLPESLTLGSIVPSLLLFFWAFRLWSDVFISPTWTILVILISLLLAFIGPAWLAHHAPRLWLISVGIVLTANIALWTVLSLLHNPAYGTDELAYDQYAASLWIHGINPYMHSLYPALQEFLVPPIFHTYTLTGKTVSQLSYPAGAFWPYVPFLLLGWHTQIGVYVDVAAWIGMAAVLFLLLPNPWRWVSLWVLSASLWDKYALGGVTDSLFLLPLVLALWRWDRYGNPDEHTWARWIGPIAFGIAMSVKQTPWFLAPFLVIALIWEDPTHWRLAVRYTVTTAATFFLINLPFLWSHPHAWLHGILLPLTAHTVPEGQGMIMTVLDLSWTNGLLTPWTHAGLWMVLSLLGLWAFAYPQLKSRLWWAIPLVFLWPTRSFSSYLLDLWPALFIASVTATAWPHVIKKNLWPLIAVTVAGLIACLIPTELSAAPLTLSVVHLQSTGQFSTFDNITLKVRNNTDHPIHPAWTLDEQGVLTTFWHPLNTDRISAHHTQFITLQAPNVSSMPSLTTPFIVDAFISHPEQLVHSRLIQPTPLQTILTPLAINHPVTHPVTLTVQVQSAFGKAQQQPNIPISLTQVTYAQQGVLPGTSAINGAAPGAQPIIVHTNRQGRATFRIRPPKSPITIYYQTSIITGSYPTSYSNIVLIHWR